MKPKENAHLDRDELLALAHDKAAQVSDHLKDCEHCRRELELLAEFGVAKRVPMAVPPESWINEAAMIMPSDSSAAKLRRLVASLTFDSWLAPEPVGVRGLGTSGRRQLRFEAGDLHIDVRAERDKRGWQMVAQVSGGSTEGLGELRHGRTVCYPDHGGIYQWEAGRPPSNLSIRVDDIIVEIPGLKWTTPSRKKKRGDT